MPVRMIDGDRICESDKLARLAMIGRADCVSHYEKLLCLAMANGTFEVDPESIARRFAKVLPWMTAVQWQSILVAYEREKLLFTWKDESTGKVWGYWIGLERRLPAQSEVVKHKWPVGARVPLAELARFQGRPVEHVEAELAETAAMLGQVEVTAARRRRADRAKGERRGACPTRGAVGGGKGLGKEEVEVVDRVSSPALRSPTAHAAAGEEGARQGDARQKNGAHGSSLSAPDGAHTKGNGLGNKSKANGGQGVNVACDYLRFERAFRRWTGGHCGGRDQRRRTAYLELVREAGNEDTVLDALQRWARKRGGPDSFRGRYDLAALDFLEGEGLTELHAGDSSSAVSSPRADPNCRHCHGNTWVERAGQLVRCECVQE